MKVITSSIPSLMPKSITNLFDAANALTSAVKLGCEGIERTTDAMVNEDHGIATLMLRQKKEQLLADIQRNPSLTSESASA